MKKNKNKQFKIRVIDKDKYEQVLFDFRNIEDLVGWLKREQEYLDNRNINWWNKLEQLWGEVNRLKEKLES